MIDTVIERIKSTVPTLRMVGRAVDFQTAVEKNPTAVPACFVIPMREQPGRAIDANVMQQRVSVTLGVIFVVRNVGDTLGGAAGVDVEQLRQAVRAQLYGWTPDPAFDPLERGLGQLLAFRDGHAWWQDQFITSYYDRSLL